MSDFTFKKTEHGLVPDDDATRSWFMKLPLGAWIAGKMRQPRNPKFHRKWWALVNFAFEHWSDTAPRLTHKGKEIQPNLERFRKDITVVAGFYDVVVNLSGELRLEAHSISFANMDEVRFEALFKKTIDALLDRVFKGPQWNEQYLRDITDEIIRFDR